MAIPRQAARVVEAGQLEGRVLVPRGEEQVLGAEVAVNDAQVVAVLHAEDDDAAQVPRVVLAEPPLHEGRQSMKIQPKRAAGIGKLAAIGQERQGIIGNAGEQQWVSVKRVKSARSRVRE